MPILSILVFLPLIGCLLLIPLWRHERAAKATALAVGIAELVVAVLPFTTRNLSHPQFFLWEDLPWIERFGIRYTLGMDGISLLLVVLTAFTTVAAMSASWRSIREKTALHYALLLAMESGIMGVFLALDLFVFYLFWELMLIPMFLLIGIWGHGRRIYSAVKFFLYTLAGSLLMLVAILALYLTHGDQTGHYTFALNELVLTRFDIDTACWLFAAFLLAFAIKVPVFPLHTWLPDAHTDAPTAGSVILAALLLKSGAYGLIRFGHPLFPQAAALFRPLLLTVAVIGILYAGWIAFAQTDMKRLIAYSSVAHMGYVMLGIAVWTPVALSGAVIQMVNHGVTTGALFMLVGILDERAHTREIEAFGGMWGRIPVYSFFFLLFSMASAGVPGLNNFVGEFLVLTGSFKTAPAAASVAFVGIVVTLAYTLRLAQGVLFGEPRSAVTVADLSWREGGTLTALAVAAIYLGVHPAPLLKLLEGPVSVLTGITGVLP